MKRLFVIAVLLLSSLPAAAQDKTISARTSGLQKLDGFVPLYWDARDGKLLMEISRFNQEFLYQVSLPTGVGSNPLGLDRGQLGNTSIVFFERVGPRVMMIKPNYRYRAITSDA